MDPSPVFSALIIFLAFMASPNNIPPTSAQPYYSYSDYSNPHHSYQDYSHPHQSYQDNSHQQHSYPGYSHQQQSYQDYSHQQQSYQDYSHQHQSYQDYSHQHQELPQNPHYSNSDYSHPHQDSPQHAHPSQPNPQLQADNIEVTHTVVEYICERTTSPRSCETLLLRYEGQVLGNRAPVYVLAPKPLNKAKDQALEVAEEFRQLVESSGNKWYRFCNEKFAEIATVSLVFKDRKPFNTNSVEDSIGEAATHVRDCEKKLTGSPSEKGAIRAIKKYKYYASVVAAIAEIRTM